MSTPSVSLKKIHIQPVETPLPPCWLRENETRPDSHEQAASNLLRVGLNHRLRNALLQTIEQAHEVVQIASFLMADDKIADALVKAATRHVRVYLLTASEEKLQHIPEEETEFDNMMVEKHKKLLNRLNKNNVVVRTAPHFHAKFLLADPCGSNPQGWLSTANFNLALQKGVELGIALPVEGAKVLADWFNWAFWKEAEHELLEEGHLAVPKPPPAQPTKPDNTSLIVVTTKETDKSLQSTLLNIIQDAKEKLFVSSYAFAENHQVVQALIEKANQGLPVVVFTRPRPKMAKAFATLAQAGISIVAHDKLHAKGVLSETAGVVMTANMDEEGLDKSFEVGMVLDESTRTALYNTFQDWQGEFPWQYAQAALPANHLGEFCPAKHKLPGRGDPIHEVVEEITVTLPDVVAKSALALDKAPDPPFPASPPTDKFPQKIRYEWKVVPPKLPPDAKEYKREIVKEEEKKVR